MFHPSKIQSSRPLNSNVKHNARAERSNCSAELVVFTTTSLDPLVDGGDRLPFGEEIQHFIS